ncbi:hypothetical protein WAI453_004600 [Rhynchosporium graminicola]
MLGKKQFMRSAGIPDTVEVTEVRYRRMEARRHGAEQARATTPTWNINVPMHH